MAKGSNANSDLYKKLHEEYGLELNIDFYLHPQSGSYIIKHNAVKKLVAKQREKGFIIETPSAEDIIVINDGTREGIHGKEVVVAGNFYLKNRDGVLIEKTYRTGEVNPKNCKNFYPHAMAEKRLYDRGVLDLLRFAQEGLYSDVEMDEFRQSAPKQKPQEKKSQQEAAAPRPKLPPPPGMTPKVSAPSNKKEECRVLALRILKLVGRSNDGISKSEIWNLLEAGKEEINDSINRLMEEGKIVKTGERRGTKYLLNSNQPSSSPSLTKVEYNEIWRSVSEDLRTKGIEYNDLMKVVVEVTGYTSPIDAFKSGSLTKEHLEIIKEKGTQLCA